MRISANAAASAALALQRFVADPASISRAGGILLAIPAGIIVSVRGSLITN